MLWAPARKDPLTFSVWLSRGDSSSIFKNIIGCPNRDVDFIWYLPEYELSGDSLPYHTPVNIKVLIRYLAIPVFNDRCQYCTRSINPNVTYAEHLIISKSLPIHSPEQTLRTLKTQSLDFLKLSLTCYFHSTLYGIVVYIHDCLKGVQWTLNFELWFVSPASAVNTGQGI